MLRSDAAGAGSAGWPEAAAYPVSLPMLDRLAVVIGGGRAAERRVAGLRAAGAEVLVIAPELSPSLAELAARGQLTARRRGYLATDLDGAWLVLACADRAQVNTAVAADAERQRVWCIRADAGAAVRGWERPSPAVTAEAVTAEAAGAQSAMTSRPRGVPETAGTARLAGGPQDAPQTAGTARLARRVLVLGGARSGKSVNAEAMLAGQGPVDYIATGPLSGAGDTEWDARVRDHRERRPAHWRTEETLDLDRVLAAGDTTAPVLVDCLSTWLARVMDGYGVWSGHQVADLELAARVDGLVRAWQASRRQVVAVSNEVGSGIVPATASGRRFRDELGQLNARIAAGCHEVWLCTAGIAQRLR